MVLERSIESSLGSNVIDTGIEKSENSQQKESKKTLSEIVSSNNTTGVLQNRLQEIIQNNQEKNTEFANPQELGLELLERDEYGYIVNIPEEYKEEILMNQKEFSPVFLELQKKYSNFLELKYVDYENPFVFSPLTIEIMSKKILPSLMKEATKLFSNDGSVEVDRSINWEESNIEGILNKLLAFESFRLERIMAPRARDYLSEQFPNEEVIKVKELCTGAGITTALMYEALGETGKNIEFHTVDNSLQSVMCAATLLTLRGIPTRFVLDSGAVEKDFKGVTIYFESALESMKKEGKYHFVFSDNGINYFDEKTHLEVVEEMISKIIPGGLFQDCTLDPSIQIDLSTLRMFQAIFSNNREPKLGDGMYDIVEKDNRKYIKQLFSPSSTMQYQLLKDVKNKLGLGVFVKYLSGAKKAAEITKKLAPKIAQDLRKTGEKVGKLVEGDCLYYPDYEVQKNSLTRFLELKIPAQNVME